MDKAKKHVHERVTALLGVGSRDLRTGPRVEMHAGHFRYRDKIFAEVRVSKRARCALTKLPIGRLTRAWVACYRVRASDGQLVITNRHSDWQVLSTSAVHQLLDGIGRAIVGPPLQPAAAATPETVS